MKRVCNNTKFCSFQILGILWFVMIDVMLVGSVM